jgi:quinolinate synthase
LADSITAEQVKQLKAQYPDYAFICYINTSAEVKAQCDVCVTSSNVYNIVERFPNDKIYFLPDQLMGMNVERYLKENNIKKTFKYYCGKCYVHDEYDPDMIQYLSLKHPDAKIVAHPECKPEVTQLADYIGSTSQMMAYVKDTAHKEYVILTECGLSSRMQLENPEKKFIGSCTMCKYMKSNRLEQILSILESPNKTLEILIDTTTMKQAMNSLQAMFKYNND